MKSIVLDASALLAMFFGEPGMTQVSELFRKAAETDQQLLVSAINWAEVFYCVRRKRGDKASEIIRQFANTMPLHVVALDRDLAELAAALKATYDLGLADASAAALAQSRKADLVTADREFKVLEKQIKIGWLMLK